MRKKFEDAYKIEANVKATMAVEGIEVSRYASVIGQRYLRDKISGEDAIALIKRRHLAIK